MQTSTKSSFLMGDSNYHIRLTPLTSQKQGNAKITLLYKDRLLFSDVIFCTKPLYFRFEDFNGDTLQDVLVLHAKDKINKSYYYLYLADTTHKSLQKVKGFEQIYHPQIEPYYHVITSIQNKKRLRYYSFYKVNPKGELNTLYQVSDSFWRDSMMVGLSFPHALRELENSK